MGFTAAEPRAASAPLFPTRSGATPSKRRTIAAWQELSPEGHPTLGGHSARRSGAKRYARMGWTLQVIMHLGRWASAAVMAYVEEALAELAPGAPRKLEESVEDWQSPLPALSVRVAAVEEKLEALRRKLPRLVKECRKSEEVVREVDILPPPLPARWVVSDVGRKLHREVSGCASAPAYMWKCGCGWEFGCGWKYSFISDREAKSWTGPRCGGGCDLSETL